MVIKIFEPENSGGKTRAMQKPSYQELENQVHQLKEEIRCLAQAKDAADKSENRYRALVETSSDWLWEIDAKARYVYSNQRIHDILGYEPQDIIGRTPFDLMPEDEVQRLTPGFSDIIAQQRAFALFENTNLHRDGRRITLETSGVPIFNEAGQFTGYRGMDREITDRKQAEEALRKSRHDLEVRVQERTAELSAINAVLGKEISERKNAQEKLSGQKQQLQAAAQDMEQARNLLQLIIESIPVRVFWKSHDLTFLGCNTLFARDAGLKTLQRLSGKMIFPLAGTRRLKAIVQMTGRSWPRVNPG